MLSARCRLSLFWSIMLFAVGAGSRTGQSATRADPQARDTTAPELQFVVKKDQLHVSDGRSSAELGITATHVLGFSHSSDRTSLTVRYRTEFACLDEEKKASFAADQLRAYLENTEALRAHRKQDYARAEVGFAKAVALFPTFKKAIFNLACAQTRQGKPEAALATLAGYLRDEPAETYAHIASDPDLVPLLATPVLEAYRTRIPGQARIRIGKEWAEYPPVVISKEKGLVAIFVESKSWGGIPRDPMLAVFDIATSRQLFTKVLIGVALHDDTLRALTRGERKTLASRIAPCNRFLTDFGFSMAKPVVQGVAGQGDTPTMRFPGSGLGLVVSHREGKARVLRKNEVLHEIKDFVGPFLQGAWYLADEKLLLFTWHVDEPEGCPFEGQLAGAEMANLNGK